MEATNPPRRWVPVSDQMQQGYRYALMVPPGADSYPEFTPDLSPQMMLTLGVFGGKYITDCQDEFSERLVDCGRKDRPQGFWSRAV